MVNSASPKDGKSMVKSAEKTSRKRYGAIAFVDICCWKVLEGLNPTEQCSVNPRFVIPRDILLKIQNAVAPSHPQYIRIIGEYNPPNSSSTTHHLALALYPNTFCRVNLRQKNDGIRAVKAIQLPSSPLRPPRI